MWWFILALVSGLCAAALAVIVKLHLGHLSSLLITPLFLAISAIVLLVVEFITNQIQIANLALLTAHEWKVLTGVGILNAVAFTAYVTALQLGKTAGVVATDRLGILFVVVFSVFFLQESWSYQTVIGALLVIGGTALLST
ncbi:MAG: EamA family transporter [Candidatus Babeliales bacterium]